MEKKEKEKALKTTGLATPVKDNPLKVLNLVSQIWAELTVLTQIFDDRSWKKKKIKKTNTGKIYSELILK